MPSTLVERAPSASRATSAAPALGADTDGPLGADTDGAGAWSAQRPRERAPERAAEQPPASLRRYLAQVVLATSLVALCPMLVVWWLRSSGMLTSYVLGMLLGVGLSLGAAHAGRLLWQTRPGSQHLLFSELMVWGFARRCYSERRLASARAVLGSMSQAQLRVANGLSVEDQTKRLEGLARALDECDPNTHGHSRRVARYAWMIATGMGLPREQVARIRTAAAVHDVGKIQTPPAVLRKAGPLSDEEFETMKRHAGDGARMVAALNDDGLTKMVRHHHERLDGSGYPSGLAGERIPLGARIIAVADTFDSITANRPYRDARTHKEAIDILLAEADTKLDGDAVRAFCRHYSGRRALTFWAWLTTLPERLLAQFGGGVASVASASKVLALAAIVGNLAAGTAYLAHPAKGPAHRIELTGAREEPSALTRASTPKSAAAHAPVAPVASAERRSAAHPRGARRLVSAQRPGTSAAATGSPAPATSAAADQTAPGDAPGAAANGQGDQSAAASRAGEQAAGKHEAGDGKSATGAGAQEGSGEGGASGSEQPRKATEQGNAKSEASQPKGEEAKSGASAAGSGGVVEGAKGKVEEVTGKVEEVKNKAVEEVTGKVEEVKGKVEEVKGKAVEEVKGKVEEVTGKAKEVLGKL